MNEIAVTLLVFAQQDEMIWVAVRPVHLVKARSTCNVYLTADDRLDTRCLCRTVKVHDAIHYAVVCNCNGILPDLFHMLHHRGDAVRAVEQAKFRMYM